jgi:quinoprotein glucose dehydrogenase
MIVNILTNAACRRRIDSGQKSAANPTFCEARPRLLSARRTFSEFAARTRHSARFTPRGWFCIAALLGGACVGDAALGGETVASPGARLAAATLRVPPGCKVTAVASEPLLANPVAFCFDPAGRIFVAETHRIKHGTEDNRDHMDWLDDDLASRTVEDRRAYIKRRMGERIGFFTENSELVRLVEDQDQDGVYDRSTIFAEGFNDIVDGAAAGVLWNGDRLWLTSIPSLWELRDADGDGQAEQRRALASGFGVHCALFGHDLHGLILGPDERIYFSIGDRGFHIETPNGVLSNPDSGAVLSCRPDGSDLRVFATGLRNPQELAFNEWGDLFTVDNNSDQGDRARVVHIVEGMTAGWRMSYQYLPDRGPFMRERIWETQNDEQPASNIPPLAHLTDGPSGLVHYPGTGLPADCAGAFFVCDFLGASGRSGVREFHLEQSGAGYRLARDSMFAQGVLATDCDFGPDGNLYVVDWLEGWTGTGKGRIYRIESDDARATKERGELRDALARIEQADTKELLALLAHADMRVRLAAQRRLVSMGAGAVEALKALTAQADAPQLARVHAIWALTALAEQDQGLFDALAALGKDGDPEIRNQIARALGAAEGLSEDRRGSYGEKLTALLADESPRVQCSAAIALGKLAHKPALADLLRVASDNEDRDPTLRHAVAMGLAGSQQPAELVAAANGASLSQRLAIVIALGRQESPLVAELLKDGQERIVLEAARVIWDTPIRDAYGSLAALVDDRRLTSEPLLRRALAASLAIGGGDRLQAVVRCGLRTNLSPAVRELAWATVSQWAAPAPRDPVHGSWRPVAARPADQTIAAVRTMWSSILASSKVDGTGVVVAAELKMPEAFGSLLGIVEQESCPPALRARAIAALGDAEESVVLEAIRSALASSNVDLRNAARRLLVKRFPARAVAALSEAAESATTLERQEAIQILAQLAIPEARNAIAAWMDRVEQNSCPQELALDVLEAAAASGDDALVARQRKYQEQRLAEDPLAKYAMCADGGDAVRGAQVFAANAALACKRCHSLKPGVQLVGPSLADVGAKRQRSELLESLVRPNAKIVEGFQTTSLLLDSGLAVAGILRREDATHAVLVDFEGKEQVVEIASIEERSQGLSAMPEDLVTHTTPRELRDLVAYLSTLRDTTVVEGVASSGHGGAAGSAESELPAAGQ